jgi:hypothetical protein
MAECQDHKSIHAHFHLYLSTRPVEIQYCGIPERQYIFHHGRTHLHEASVSHTVDHGQLPARQSNKTTINIGFVFWNITSCKCSDGSAQGLRQKNASKRRNTSTRHQGVTSQRTAKFRVASVRNLNPKNCNTRCLNLKKP